MVQVCNHSGDVGELVRVEGGLAVAGLPLVVDLQLGVEEAVLPDLVGEPPDHRFVDVHLN